MSRLPVRSLAALAFLCVGLLLAGCTAPPAPAPLCDASIDAAGNHILDCPGGDIPLTVSSTDGFGIAGFTADELPTVNWDIVTSDGPCEPYFIEYLGHPRIGVHACSGTFQLVVHLDEPGLLGIGNTDAPLGSVTVTQP